MSVCFWYFELVEANIVKWIENVGRVVVFPYAFAPSGRVDVCMCLGCYPKLWDFALSGRENIA